MIQKLNEFYFQPISSIRLHAFRICMGVSILCYMLFRLRWAGEWLTGQGFHLAKEHLPYHDFWVPALPEQALIVFVLCFVGVMIAFITNWKFHIIKWVLLGLVLYVTWVDQISAFSPNKLMIFSLLLLASADMGRCGDNGTKVSAWPLRVLQMTILIHLFMAGWSKVVFGEWLSNPYVLWYQMQGTYRNELASWMLRTLPDSLWAFLQCNALIFEFLAPVLFISRKLRWIGLIWGVVFQIIIGLSMAHIIFFNLVIMSFFVVFMKEEHLQKCFKLLKIQTVS